MAHNTKRFGCHFYTNDVKMIIQQLKKAEQNVFNNPLDPPNRLFIENDYPKSIVVLGDNVVNVYAYCPQPDGVGLDGYQGWIVFPTRRNSYSQKRGGICATQGNCIRISFWKAGQKLQQIKLDDKQGTTMEDVISFVNCVYEVVPYEHPRIIPSPKDDFVGISVFDRLLGFPLLWPETGFDHLQVVEETRLLKFVRG